MSQQKNLRLRVHSETNEGKLNEDMVKKLQSIYPHSFVTYEVLELFFNQLWTVLKKLEEKQLDYEKMFIYYKKINDFEIKIEGLEKLVNRIAQVVLPLQEQFIDKIQKNSMQQGLIEKYFSTFPQQLDLIIKDRFHAIHNLTDQLTKQVIKIQEENKDMQQILQNQDKDIMQLLKSYKELLQQDQQLIQCIKNENYKSFDESTNEFYIKSKGSQIQERIFF